MDQPDFEIEVDGRSLPAHHGQTVAAVLLGAGIRAWRRMPSGARRGMFCGMGVCFDCLVSINGQPDQRACMTPAQPGMRVQLTWNGTPSHDQD